MIDISIGHTFKASCYENPLEKYLAHFGQNFDIDESIEEVNTLLDSVSVMYNTLWNLKVESLPVSTSIPVPSIIEIPKLELKPLPDMLKYAFLGESETLPVIISSHLDKDQERKLRDILGEHKKTIGWTIKDIKRIIPSVVMYQIYLKKNVKTSREPQRRLNPILKEIVRAEVMKLLDVGIIYPISNSQ